MKKFFGRLVLTGLCFLALFVFSADKSCFGLPGSSVYHLTPCVDCHSNGSVARYARHMVIKVLDEKGKDLYNKSTNTITIPFKRGGKVKLTTVLGSDGQLNSEHLLAAWFYKLPAGVSTSDGNVSYCFQQINYPGGSEFAYKGNQNLTTAESVLFFDKYFEEQESQLWLALGKRTVSKKGLGLKSVKIKWQEEFE